MRRLKVEAWRGRVYIRVGRRVFAGERYGRLRDARKAAEQVRRELGTRRLLAGERRAVA